MYNLFLYSYASVIIITLLFLSSRMDNIYKNAPYPEFLKVVILFLISILWPIMFIDIVKTIIMRKRKEN